MDIFALIFIFVLYHIPGEIILFIIANCSDTIGNCVDMEFLSPIWQYKNFKVNLFGAIMLAAFFNILIPAASIAYWFCKLCTVGRK